MSKKDEPQEVSSDSELLSGIGGKALLQDLSNELLGPFRAEMEIMYTAEVHWDRYDRDNPMTRVLREHMDALYDAVKAIFRKHQDNPELSVALRMCVREIDEYQFEDDPVFSEGVLDRRASRVRSDYATDDDRKQRPEWVDHVTTRAFDREPILRRERGRLAEAIVQVIAEAPGKPTEMPRHIGRLEWGGSTISFIEIFDGLALKGYLEFPEGNVTEFIRRLQQSIVVLKEEDQSELSTESLANRSRNKRNDVLRERMDALPDAKKKKPKG